MEIMVMTVDDIHGVIDEIEVVLKEGINSDPIAHASEDMLYQNVLHAIADGVANPKELAKEALKVAKLKFSRWYE